MRRGPAPAERKTGRQSKPDNTGQRAVPIELIPLDVLQALVPAGARTVAISLYLNWDGSINFKLWRFLATRMTMRADSSKRLTIFTEAEKLALYGLPDFDDFQRAEFFAFSKEELALADRRRGIFERLHCLLQLGYFKAKHAFFGLTTDIVPTEDIGFVAERYFQDIVVQFRPLMRPSELYAQRAEIARLFGFRLWSEADRPALVEAATELARRDVTPSFIGLELLGVLKDRKIVRPGYTTLQSVIGTALTVERKRLDHLVETALDEQTVKALRDLLVREGTLIDLAALAELNPSSPRFGGFCRFPP